MNYVVLGHSTCWHAMYNNFLSWYFSTHVLFFLLQKRCRKIGNIISSFYLIHAAHIVLARWHEFRECKLLLHKNGWNKSLHWSFTHRIVCINWSKCKFDVSENKRNNRQTWVDDMLFNIYNRLKPLFAIILMWKSRKCKMINPLKFNILLKRTNIACYRKI